MAQYATNDEIVDESPNIAVIQNAEDSDLTRWAVEAYIRVNIFCQQKFDFEQQATKTINYTYRSNIVLPKVLSGDITMYSRYPGEDASLVDNDSMVELSQNSYSLRYNLRNRSYPDTSLTYLDITGDWGYPDSKLALLIAASNDLADLYEAHRVSTSYHLAADTTNVLTAPDATALASVLVQLNDLKAKYNLHIASAVFHSEADTELVTAVNATDEATALLLAADLKAKYNVHIASTDFHLVEDEAVSKLSVSNAILPAEIKLAFIKVTQRLALRDNQDDIRYQNSGFTSESWGDGYSYNLSNADLRQPIHPSDAVLLWEHVNHGTVVI